MTITSGLSVSRWFSSPVYDKRRPLLHAALLAAHSLLHTAFCSQLDDLQRCIAVCLLVCRRRLLCSCLKPSLLPLTTMAWHGKMVKVAVQGKPAEG